MEEKERYFMRWVIFDLDGTLADIGHRLHHIKKEPADWDAFNKECLHDHPMRDIVKLLHVVHQTGYSVAILSGRDNAYRSLTEQWLRSLGITWSKLLLRPHGDHRSDTVVKREMFVDNFDKQEVWFVIEDRTKVVKMWREMGLTCLQCREGDC